jgi:hypothetical protein
MGTRSTAGLCSTAMRSAPLGHRGRLAALVTDRWLAAQELVDGLEGLTTRVVVLDADRRTQISASSPRRGIANPVAFEGVSLVYRHWHHRAGDREMRLDVKGD